jgi:flagellar hook-associated protein 2
MGTSIDGLVSGLDTTSLINSLMQAEAVPQTLLKNQASTAGTQIAVLQALNTKIAALATLAESATKPAGVDLHTATSSSASLTATAGVGAADGQIDIVVGQTAQAQVGVSAAMTAWADDPAVLTIVAADGTSSEITPASTSLADVASAINNAGLGVKATRVAAGTDPATGAALYRLQLSSTATGADGAFTVYRGSAADVTAGTATDLLTEAGAAVVKTARDAEVTLWAGTPAAQTITSSTNTFTDLLPGVNVTVSAASTDPVTVTIARDDAGIAKVASGLVDAMAGIFSFVAQQSATKTGTDAAGGTIVTGGPLSGDSQVRQISQALLDAATSPVDGVSPSTYGISITKDGTVEFSSEAFQKALAADPEKTVGVLQTIAQRVADAANRASDSYEGSLTTLVKSRQSALDGLNDQISEWDTRLADRRATLEKTYAALEVSLSNLKSQSSWLTSQLASLPTSSTS